MMDSTLTEQQVSQDELAAKLAAYGIDYPDAMDRMGDNAELYEKLAMKYLDNDCMATLKAAMAVKDYSGAYQAAHTLKGASGNLSFKDLFQASASISSALYEGEYEAAEALLPEVETAHQKAVAGLVAWQNGTL